MPLVNQEVQIPFVGGIDTKTATKAVPAGKLLALENMVFARPGELRKRNGYDALSQTVYGQSTGISTGNALINFNNELLECDSTTLYSYTASEDTWTSKGPCVSPAVTQASVLRNSYGQSSQDGIVTSKGLEMFAFEDTSGGVQYLIRDSITGQTVVPSKLVSTTGIKPKTLICGSTFVLLYVETSTWQIMVGLIPVNLPTSTMTITEATSLAGSTALNRVSPNYDAGSWGVGNDATMYFSYNTVGIETITFGYVATNLTSPYATASITGVNGACDAITVFEDLNSGGPIVVRYNVSSDRLLYTSYAPVNDPGGFIVAASATLVTATGAVTSITGTSTTDINGNATGFIVFYGTAPAGYATTNQVVVAANYVVGVHGVNTRSVSPSGKAWCYAGLAYVPTTYVSNSQNSYWVIDQNGHIVSKHLYGLGGGTPNRADHLGTIMLPESSQVDSTTWRLPLLQQDLLTTLSNTTYVPTPDNPGPVFNPSTNLPTVVYTQTGISTNDITFSHPLNSYLNTTLAKTLHLSGGFISQYDGVSVSEHGFNIYIELAQNAVAYSATGGGIGISNGLVNTYWVTATYEWTDNEGNTHVSNPSVPVFFQTGIGVTTGSLAITLPTLQLTNKAGSPVTLKVYRTVGNGDVFYAAITSVLPHSSPTTNQPILNDKSVATVTFIDVMTDAQLLGNQQLYTTGNVLGNIEPNATSAMTVYNNRIIALDSTDPLTFWYSKAVVPGTPVQFSEFLTYNVDPRGGPVTGLAALDQLLILFKETSIYYVTGDGLTATGNGQGFSVPILVTTDCGATNQRSIVVIPGGLIFQSPTKGWHFLTQGTGNVDYIGADVAFYNGYTTTSAQLIPDTNQVRFTVTAPAGSNQPNVTLVFDYFMRQWAVFTPMDATDSCIFEGQFTYLKANGQVFQENPDSFSDNGSWITALIKTSWLQFAAMMGFQRVRQYELLYTLNSPCTINVKTTYDFNPAFLQNNSYTPQVPSTWGSDSVWGGGGPGDTAVWGGPFGVPTQLRVLCSQQKSQAMQVTVSDSQVGTLIGEGASFSGLTVTVGIKKGAFRMGPSATVG